LVDARNVKSVPIRMFTSWCVSDLSFEKNSGKVLVYLLPSKVVLM
jgi:hypothetical protein